MTQQTYRKMMGYFLQDKKKICRIVWANRIFTGIVFFSYPLYLLYLFFFRRYFPAAGGTGTGGFICGSVGVT